MRLRGEAEKTSFSSSFEKKTLECQRMFSCLIYLKTAANVLREKISKTSDEEFIHCSHVGQNFSHALYAKVGPKTCSAIERFIKCSKELSQSWETTKSDGTKSSG